MNWEIHRLSIFWKEFAREDPVRALISIKCFNQVCKKNIPLIQHDFIDDGIASKYNPTLWLPYAVNEIYAPQ